MLPLAGLSHTVSYHASASSFTCLSSVLTKPERCSSETERQPWQFDFSLSHIDVSEKLIYSAVPQGLSLVLTVGPQRV